MLTARLMRRNTAPRTLVRRGITADNPTGIYLSYNLGWHNPTTGNFGGNLTLAELNPSTPPAVYSIKLFFNDQSTFIQDYWGDYRITHYQSGAYHIQPGTTLVNGPNRTRTYQFNAMYPVSGNASVQSAFLGAASLLHGPNYSDRETGFQRDDVRVTNAAPDLPTAPFGPFVRSEASRNAPGGMNQTASTSDSGGSNVPLYAGVAAGVVALILLLVAAVFIMRRKKAKKNENVFVGKAGKNDKGWGPVESSPGSVSTITAPAPGSGFVAGASEKFGPAKDVSGPPPAMTHGGVGRSGQAGYGSEDPYAHPAQEMHHGGGGAYGEVSHFVMGDNVAATHEEHQLEFVEQYASANYQPNPYRDTMQTGIVPNGHNPYRDTIGTMDQGYQHGYHDAPPVPTIPSNHQYHAPTPDNDVDVEEMMERYGHDSMYPQQMGKFQYDQYDAPPMPTNYRDDDRYARETYMPPPSASAGHYGGSTPGSGTLKQRLEEEEYRIAAQQRQLAQQEAMYLDDSTMTGLQHSNSGGSYRYDEGQKTAGVVRSRSTISKAPKSPMRTDPPKDWLGGAGGSYAQGSELSRSAPGPNYI